MADYRKCNECKHLSDERSSIGRKCVCPGKEFKTRTAMWKQPTGRSCKKFEEK